MPKIDYRPWPSRIVNPEHVQIIQQADAFARQYARQGYSLTLRQLYYRFVAAGLIRNKDSEYKRLGALIGDARYAGMIDWQHLEDRTRNVHVPHVWDDPVAIVKTSADAFVTHKWTGQPKRLEVWVEKDALVDVVSRAANRLHVPYFSCRGYTSSSEMWNAAQRLKSYVLEDVHEDYNDGYGAQPVIIHLGDHDPSGIDMTIDIESRLLEFLWHDLEDSGIAIPPWLEPYGEYMVCEKPWEAYSQALVNGEQEHILVQRIALNRDQIAQYNPPPNPAKTTDSRFARYIDRTGLRQSWELDALEPAVLDTLIDAAIRSHLETSLYDAEVDREKVARDRLSVFSTHYDDLMAYAIQQQWITP